MTDRILTITIGATVSAILAFTLGIATFFGGGTAEACTLPAGPSPTGTAIGKGVNAEQYANATAIVRTGADLGVPARGWIIAVAVAIQESSLRVVNHGDAAGPDSRGLFQQRAPWGPETERMDPIASARLFYTGGHGGQDGLLDIPGWQDLPLTRAAQAVQRSAYPNAYAAHEDQAAALAAAISSGFPRARPEDLAHCPSNCLAIASSHAADRLRGQAESASRRNDAEASPTASPSATADTAPCPDAVSAIPGTSQAWIAPVDAPVRSGFRTTKRPGHDGVDLAAARGTPVRAASSGTITRIRCNVVPASHSCDRDGGRSIGGYGWYLDIRHPGGVSTRYAHLRQRPHFAVGVSVETGQRIGYVGASGHATGPHLHLEVRMRTGNQSTQSQVIDPLAFFVKHGITLE